MSPSLSDRVNVLILGGLVHVGRALLCHLINLSASGDQPSIAHVRFVDKYLVARDASTA